MRDPFGSVPDDDRAVSEIVGFILVFSLVLGTITAVYVGGLASLDTTRDAERATNAERAFDVLANNFQQLGRGEAPRRATEIKLEDADLTLGDRHALNVNASGTLVVTSSRPLTYDSGSGTWITYEHGAVIRVDRDGGTSMLREPDFLITPERTVIRNIELRGGRQQVGGSTTVLVRAERGQPQQIYPTAGTDAELNEPANLTLQTEPERVDAWLRYLEERSSISNCRTTLVDERSQINCDLDVEAQRVARTRVEVEIT